MNIWKRMDFGSVRQIFVGQLLFLPTSPDVVYQYYSITPKASTCHEVQGKERVWLEWAGRRRIDTVSHGAQRSVPFQISTAHLCPCQDPGLPTGCPPTLSVCYLCHRSFPGVLLPRLYSATWPWEIQALQLTSSHLWSLRIHSPQMEAKEL